MARNLTSLVKIEIGKQKVHPVVFVQLDFLTGSVFLWSGLGSLVWNGITWLGVGTLGSISPVQETTQLTATNLSMSLSGIPANLLDDALVEIRQGKPAIAWLGVVDDSGAVIVDPYQAFAGRIDSAIVDENGDTSTITLTIENALIDLQRIRQVRFTDQSQQAEFPGDLGFNFVPSLQEKNVLWGIAGPGIAHGGSGGGGGNSGRNPPIARGA